MNAQRTKASLTWMRRRKMTHQRLYPAEICAVIPCGTLTGLFAPRNPTANYTSDRKVRE